MSYLEFANKKYDVLLGGSEVGEFHYTVRPSNLVCDYDDNVLVLNGSKHFLDTCIVSSVRGGSLSYSDDGFIIYVKNGIPYEVIVERRILNMLD